MPEGARALDARRRARRAQGAAAGQNAVDLRVAEARDAHELRARRLERVARADARVAPDGRGLDVAPAPLEQRAHEGAVAVAVGRARRRRPLLLARPQPQRAVPGDQPRARLAPGPPRRVGRLAAANHLEPGAVARQRPRVEGVALRHDADDRAVEARRGPQVPERRPLEAGPQRRRLVAGLVPAAAERHARTRGARGGVGHWRLFLFSASCASACGSSPCSLTTFLPQARRPARDGAKTRSRPRQRRRLFYVFKKSLAGAPAAAAPAARARGAYSQPGIEMPAALAFSMSSAVGFSNSGS